MLRELAWIDHELTPTPDTAPLISDQDFEREIETVAAGGWEEVGLDPLPAEWKPASIEELRNA